MDTHDELMDLAQLCAATGATPRTVRYYIQQGLLPQPGAGREGRKYGPEFLHRLRLIRQLQREHLPLAEIRQRLGALSSADIAAFGGTAGPARSDGTPGDSAREYLEQLLGPRGFVPAPAPATRMAAARHFSPPISEWPLQERHSVRAPTPSSASPDRAPSDTTVSWPRARSQWERLTLHEDVELHVRRPASREMNRRIERLIEAARRILEED